MARIPVVVDLVSNAAERGIANLKSQLSGLGPVDIDTDEAERNVQGLTGQLKGLLPALGAAAVVGGIAAIGKAGFGAALEIGQLADAALTSTDRIQQLQVIANRTGGSIDSLADGQRELRIRLGELAAHGAGPAKDALDSLGISMEDLADKSPEEQMDFLIEALLGVEDTSQRVFLAEELLGGQFAENSRILQLTASEYRKYAEEGDNSRKISEDNIRAIENLNNGFNKVKTTLLVLTSNVLGTVINFIRNMNDDVKIAIGVVTAAAAAVFLLPPAFTAAVAGVRALTIAIAANPLGLLIITLTTVGALIYTFRDDIRNGLLSAVQFIAKFAEGAVDLFLSMGEGILNGYNSTFGLVLPKVKIDFDSVRDKVSNVVDNVVGKLESWKATTDENTRSTQEVTKASEAAEGAIFGYAGAVAVGTNTANAGVTANDNYGASLRRVMTDALAAGAAIDGLYTAQQRLELAMDGFGDVISAAESGATRAQGAAGVATAALQAAIAAALNAEAAAARAAAAAAAAAAAGGGGGYGFGNVRPSERSPGATPERRPVDDQPLSDFDLTGDTLETIEGTAGVGISGISTRQPSSSSRRRDPAPPGEDMLELATGGIVTRPTVAMIGEAGPEAVIPLNRMQQQPIVIEVRTDPSIIVEAVNDGISTGDVNVVYN